MYKIKNHYLQKIIAEYAECTPTSYQILGETNQPHDILFLYLTIPDHFIVTGIDPSCVLNLL